MARQSNAQAMAALRKQIQEWMHIAATGFSITSIQVSIPEVAQGKTLALVRILLNDSLQMTGMMIIKGANGPFLAYPNRLVGDDGQVDPHGELRSTFYPCTPALRDQLEDAALTAYNELLTKVSGK